jgi:two-component system cell cycle response regulator
MPVIRVPADQRAALCSASEQGGHPHRPPSESGSPEASGAGSADWDPTLVADLSQLALAPNLREARRCAAMLEERLGSAAERLRPLVEALLARAREVEQLQRLSGVDELTGVANRRAFNDALHRELARAEREGRPLALLLLDLDGLKLINDELGHPAGDQALHAVARCAARSVRHGDLLARIGGDEFAIVLPATAAEEARAIGKRIREQLRRLRVQGAALGVSLGLAVAHADELDGHDEQALLCAADIDLYRDKLARKSLRPAG